MVINRLYIRTKAPKFIYCADVELFVSHTYAMFPNKYTSHKPLCEVLSIETQRTIISFIISWHPSSSGKLNLWDENVYLNLQL